MSSFEFMSEPLVPFVCLRALRNLRAFMIARQRGTHTNLGHTVYPLIIILIIILSASAFAFAVPVYRWVGLPHPQLDHARVARPYINTSKAKINKLVAAAYRWRIPGPTPSIYRNILSSHWPIKIYLGFALLAMDLPFTRPSTPLPPPLCAMCLCRLSTISPSFKFVCLRLVVSMYVCALIQVCSSMPSQTRQRAGLIVIAEEVLNKM